MGRRRFVTALAITLSLGAPLGLPGAAASDPVCSALTPLGDGQSDAATINACLARGGTTALVPGQPFLVDTGLVVTRSNTTLTSTVDGQRAVIQAMPSLVQPMLAAISTTGNEIDNLTITWIAFDGNRSARLGKLADLCQTSIDKANASNVQILGGSGHVFRYNESSNALCSTALRIRSNYNGTPIYTVADNTFENNGASPYPSATFSVPMTNSSGAVVSVAPQADGITVSNCSGGDITRNTIIDASDVGIVSFTSQGQACDISNNHIEQRSQHLYAGIHLGAADISSSDPTVANHSGTTVAHNTIVGAGQMSIGIDFGVDAWRGDTSINVVGGQFTGNEVTGAFWGMDVQGTVGGSVGSNSFTLPAVPANGPAACVAQQGLRAANWVVYPPRAVGTSYPTGYSNQRVSACLP
jgi:hypothetical protein